MSKIIKNTSFYTVGNILPQAAGFILLPIYTRYLSTADYGIVGSMQVLSTILVIFFTMALDRSYRLYFDYKTKEEKRNYLGTITVSLFFISLFVLLLLFVFKKFVGQVYKSIEFYPYYTYAILMSFFTIFSLIPKIYYQVTEKADKFIFISILEFLLSTGFVLWFIIGKHAGAAGMLKGKMMATIVILPLFIFISCRTVNFTFKPKIIKESLAFSLPMIPALLSAWILNLSDRIFIERYFDLHDVGIYSLGYKIAGAILIFSGAFNKAYNPVFYKLANSEDQKVAKEKLFKYNNAYIIIIVMAAFIISLFSKEVIQLLLDPDYFEAYKIVPIIALAYLISQTSGLLNLSIYQEKKTLQIMFMILGSACLNIGLNFLLVPRFGAYGAAYATVISFMVFFAVKYWYAKKCYFIPFRWGKIFQIFTPLFTCIILFHFFIKINIYYSLIIKIVVFGIIGLFFLKKYYKQVKFIFKGA